jgi:hypothetical protein
METLLKVLEKLYSTQGDSGITDEDGDSYFNDCDIKEEAEELCNEHLITKFGGCNWDNINILRNNGYLVFAGEKDSFGWLTGCVKKKGDRRVLVYG